LRFETNSPRHEWGSAIVASKLPFEDITRVFRSQRPARIAPSPYTMGRGQRPMEPFSNFCFSKGLAKIRDWNERLREQPTHVGVACHVDPSIHLARVVAFLVLGK
jgi:hypothetical protein